MAYSEGVLSPLLFRRWSGIALVAGALERRVWVNTRFGPVYPNQYNLLVAPPGVGKRIIDTVRDLWRETLEPGTKVPAFKLSPDSMTKASLMDALAKARQLSLVMPPPLTEYHSLLVTAEEFSVLLPAYDLEFIGVLNRVWNNPHSHSETRRTGMVKEINILYPQLNILGGVQPGWLASVFPEEAWSTGLASRLMMIYSSEVPEVDLFEDFIEDDELRPALLARLGKFSTMYGQLEWDPDARQTFREWHRARGASAPEHSKLLYYCNRRAEHLLKLIIV